MAEAPFCVAIIDIDEFKRVNDEHGHLVGDELLKQFAAEMRSVCRSTDTIGRWGGDEFILLLHCGTRRGHGADRPAAEVGVRRLHGSGKLRAQ